MRLFSYIVARDFGFAPNPFFGVCTLATCKPNIRRVAALGDWVIGTGGSQNRRSGYLVYAMRINESLTFNEYWCDPRFIGKKPNLRGSRKQAFGDNIYFKDNTGQWHQSDSHHSYPRGVPNPFNITHDTQADRVLISSDYAYWGGVGPKIPEELRNFQGIDICARRNHKSRFHDSLVAAFLAWFDSLQDKGFLGSPLNWQRMR